METYSRLIGISKDSSRLNLQKKPSLEERLKEARLNECRRRSINFHNHPVICKEAIQQIFLYKIFKSDSCWIWNGGENGTQGYGMYRDPDGKNHFAHRYAYEMFVGPIPKGLTIDHLCMNKLCVNPEHLEVVTRAVNVQRYFAVRRDLIVKGESSVL